MITKAEIRITEADFCIVRDVVHKYCGIALGEEKQAMVRARLAKQIRMQGFDSAGEYLKHVLADTTGDGFSGFIDAITTNLTSFFRESEHFRYLKDKALPALLDRKASTGDRRLLAWSAACSSGEEPYTLAMTIAETLSESKARSQKIDVRILATDISTRVLRQARSGVYEMDRMTGVSEQHRQKYFADVTRAPSQPQQLMVGPEIRSMVQFRSLNLMNAWPFRGPFDFIFCRNVMIYFDKPTQEALIERFWNYLRPGGFLFTGHSESLTRINHRFANRLASVYEKPSDV